MGQRNRKCCYLLWRKSGSKTRIGQRAALTVSDAAFPMTGVSMLALDFPSFLARGKQGQEDGIVEQEERKLAVSVLVLEFMVQAVNELPDCPRKVNKKKEADNAQDLKVNLALSLSIESFVPD